ncbi:MAG: UDP-N-acetylmuramate dehydrogenase [Ignavibacteria bacterium]|nr:UDP-N-acetylmuramate dehydrogenase [Bacteroidota bacterium]MSQ46341.1 UDP-N-acetylmuramate dehydrogenase [Ignavibacteria bacterium]
MINLEELKKSFRGFIALSEPMSKYTSFRIGGPADVYIEPADKFDLVKIIDFLKTNNEPYIIIGRGSNLLISDEGYRGVVLNFESGLSNISIKENIVTAESGVATGRFVDFCIQNNLAGVEMLAGIPGTVGGAIMMNAGAYGGEISDFITEVEILRDGKIQTISKANSNFKYRKSGFLNDIIIGGNFSLPKGNTGELLKRRRELLLKRNESQPLNFPNSGSMFKNPEGTFAAKEVESVGLKGKQVGGAQISEKHGNFILNKGNAKANDVFELIKIARETVFQKNKIKLELEVKMIGFSQQEYEQVHI